MNSGFLSNSFSWKENQQEKYIINLRNMLVRMAFLNQYIDIGSISLNGKVITLKRIEEAIIIQANILKKEFTPFKKPLAIRKHGVLSYCRLRLICFKSL